MEFLRKTFLTVIIILALLTSAAQNNKPLREAFEASYNAEYSGDYVKAIESLKKVYQENSYEINLRLGWLSYNLGSFTESAAYYNKAIQLMPYSIEARLGFVLPASAMGNWEHVVNAYQEILRIDPNHYVTNYRMGLIYYYREDYQKAQKYFERIVNMYPFDHDALLMHAWNTLKLGKSREARVLFEKVLLNKPNDDSALQGLSQIKN